jgi:hypothetical protein
MEWISRYPSSHAGSGFPGTALYALLLQEQKSPGSNISII